MTRLDNGLTRANSDFFAQCSTLSDRYIDLEPGVSGAEYTAPANGYFYAAGIWDNQGSGFNITFDVAAKHYGVMNDTGQAGPSFGKVICPVAKGDVVTFSYSKITLSDFRFIYAEGDSNV